MQACRMINYVHYSHNVSQLMLTRYPTATCLYIKLQIIEPTHFFMWSRKINWQSECSCHLPQSPRFLINRLINFIHNMYKHCLIMNYLCVCFSSKTRGGACNLINLWISKMEKPQNLNLFTLLSLSLSLNSIFNAYSFFQLF